MLGQEYTEREEFERDFNQMIWITYKQEFRPLLIEKSEINGRKIHNLTSDCGWGCTIRSV